MLTKLHVENFRCLRSIDLDLEPLTVLVGPNGSGKSAVLDALRGSITVLREDVWQRRADVGVERIVVRNGERSRQRLTPQQGFNGGWRTAQLHVSPDRLRESNHVKQERYLHRTGINLANVFGTLPRRQQTEIASRLCQLVPLFADVDVRPAPQAGHHRIVFQDRWAQDVWYEPAEVSDGTMVVLAFLVIAASGDAPDLLTIEEPEHSLHPFLLGEVIALLRKLANGELGKPVQVVLATHSAELLNFVEPREVRFLSRNLEDGSTVIRSAPIESEQWQNAWEEYAGSLGNIWLSGSVGGVPGLPPGQ